MQILEAFRCGLIAVIAAGCSQGSQVAGNESVETAVRSWYAAVLSNDSVGIDTLSAPPGGLIAARRIHGGSQPSTDAVEAVSRVDVKIIDVTHDSAFAEVKASSSQMGSFAVVLARPQGRWLVANAAPLRRD